ncbi:MAG TPA: hypothetical protein VMQ83_03165 [Gammaproteobacteria bacterium]|nr:hypothetical protein [Gammaproteobacteria bacterium]
MEQLHDPHLGRSQGEQVLAFAATAAGHKPRPGLRRMWIDILAGLVIVSVLMFWGGYLLDYSLASGTTARGPEAIAYFFNFDPGLLTDALPALGTTIVAVFGIVLTVVAIIVQLSSDRYTGVALMFLRDGINIAVMSFYVIAGLCSIWLSVSLQPEFVPRFVLVSVLLAASLALALMLPYFAYVFWFLEPGNIVNRIRYHATRLASRGSGLASPEKVPDYQVQVLRLVEEITDIANNSISGKDKIITSRAVDALRDFLLAYIASKPTQDHAWFRIDQGIREDPDFVAMDRELMQELDLRWLWVEWKTLRQYLGIYNEALSSMQDINYLIAIDTRYIGEAAAADQRHEHREIVSMVFRFMNSYLRAAINQGSVRTAYNVLHQYRLLIESMLALGRTDAALEAVEHLKYYGGVAAEQDLHFITETVAYDLAALSEYAHRNGFRAEDQVLTQLLDLDGPARNRPQELALRGIRKAQVKLATYYLSVGAEAQARTIASDMAGESPEMLRSICDELGQAASPHFWEIVDRGRNFEYLPPTQRPQLPAFLNLLDGISRAAPSRAARR